MCRVRPRILETRGIAYLTADKDGAERIEELEGRQDVALDQQASDYRCRRPPASADWHLEEPLLQRQTSQISGASQHCRHFCV